MRGACAILPKASTPRFLSLSFVCAFHNLPPKAYAFFERSFRCFVYAVFKVRRGSVAAFSLHALSFAACFEKNKPGGHLLSRTVSSAVPSADRVLTVVFGMGTGVSPGRIAARFFQHLRVRCARSLLPRCARGSLMTEQ